MRNKKGFTLAEVLITLAILGIMAAIATSILTGTSDDKKNAAAFKKGLSSLNNAIKRNKEIYNTGVESATGGSSLTDVFAKNLCIINRITSGSNWPTTKVNDAYNSQGTLIYTQDGLKMLFVLDGPCEDNTTVIQKDMNNQNANCRGAIDTNSDGEPNMAGKDIFYFNISTSGVTPRRANGSLDLFFKS